MPSVLLMTSTQPIIGSSGTPGGKSAVPPAGKTLPPVELVPAAAGLPPMPTATGPVPPVASPPPPPQPTAVASTETPRTKLSAEFIRDSISRDLRAFKSRSAISRLEPRSGANWYRFRILTPQSFFGACRSRFHGFDSQRSANLAQNLV